MNSTNMQIHPISLGMVNTYLVKGQGCILVDTGMSNHVDKIIQTLESHSVKPKDISLIVITHNHTDHVGGLKKLREITGAKVAIHKSEAPALAAGKTTEVKPNTFFGKVLIKLLRNAEAEQVQADILIDGEYDLNEFGIAGKLIHTPGHTPGSISVLLHNKEMIVGDLFTGKDNKASKPIFATDPKELKSTLEAIVNLAPSKIYTSHGKACKVDTLSNLIKKL